MLFRSELINFSSFTVVLKFPYLRTSFTMQGKKVSDIIKNTLPNTIILAISAIIIAIILGILLGIISAVLKDSYIDTQHAWASGYDWRNKFDNIWDDFDNIVGMKYLVALHLNDSKSELGSRVDRHDNIGMGKLGKKTFKSFMQEKKLQHLAGYLETPGGPEMWKSELAILRKLTEE